MADTETEASEPIDCLVRRPSGGDVRGFLRLPDSAGSGELRLVEDIPELAGTRELESPLPLVLQTSAMGTPACVVDGFPTHHGIQMPTPPAYPLVFCVNEAIVGSSDPAVKYESACLQSDGALDFFETSRVTPGEAVASEAVDNERASGGFGDLSLKFIEMSTRQSGRISMDLRWTSQVTLEGKPRTLNEWADPLTRALSFFSFCVDRPLSHRGIYAPTVDGPVVLHAAWREGEGPSSTVPLLTERGLGESTFSDLTNNWATLWDNAEHFAIHVHSLQNHGDQLTLDDRLLVLVRTIELYHGYASRFASSIRSRAEQKQLRERVVGSLPQDMATHSKWIEGALNESNRKRLTAQITELLEDLGPEVRRECGIDVSPSKFAGVVSKTRNHFTHPKKKVPNGVPDGIELLVLIHQLWFVVRACALLELGQSREDIARALRISAGRHYIVRGVP